MSGEWNVDTLHQHLAVQLSDLRAMLRERYETQTKAVDAAFAAQQTAMKTALDAASAAVAVALGAAEKAVGKAENAAEKRFESINEFRGQLSDQASSFIARTEAEARLQALAEKIDAETIRTSEKLGEINKRLDLSSGSQAAIARVIAIGFAIATIVITVVSVLANILTKGT